MPLKFFVGSVLFIFLITSLIYAHANYISPCGKTNLTDSSGTIRSPYYPKPFPYQIKCEWTIYTPNENILKLEVIDLDLNGDCTQHWLTVPLEGRHDSSLLCGKAAPRQPIIVFQDKTVIEYFSSEVKKENRGFSLIYSFDVHLCQPFEIHCKSGGCVDNTSRCNGLRDCEDGSDEFGCNVGTWCPDGTTPCASSPKHCFSQSDQTCDGNFVCPRGEDEIGCAPGCPNQIACTSGDGCYDPSQRCNGIRNCHDNSDENDCKEKGCGPMDFICQNSACVAVTLLCNDVNDCGDFSDEQHCAKSSLLAAATIGLLACVFLSCIGLSCLYRFYTARLRASTVFLEQLDTDVLDESFVYREPPPSYAVAVAESHPLPPVEHLESVPRRQRRRQRRRRMSAERLVAQNQAKQRGLSQIELDCRIVEPQWRTPASSPSLSPSRESLTSSTSLDDLILN